MADLSPDDRDWIIRTIAGEADSAGQAAVANVIKNRMQSGGFGGPTGKGVVMSPGQFSMWNRLTGYAHGAGANDIGTTLSPNSSTYKEIGKTVDNVFSGSTPDPTKGALNYYAPGSASPAWAASMKNPTTIGSQVYGTAGPARPVTPTPTPTPGVTLNTPAAAAPVGPGPGNVGPVTGFLPGQSTGQGGIGSDVVASKDAGAPAAPSIASQVAGPLQALTKDLEDSGKGQPQGGAPDQAAQLQAQQAAAMAGVGRQQELRARAEQMWAALLAQGQRPLSWNSAPPGSGAGLQIMAPTTTPGGGYVGGTTLNSIGDSYG